MPRSLDLQPVKVTHSPTERLDLATSKLKIPLPDPVEIVTSLITMIESVTGLNLTFLKSALNGIDLSSPGAILAAITAPIQALINGITGGTSNPLSALISNLLGVGSTASTANTNANTGLASLSSLLSGSGLGSFSSIGSAISSATSSLSSLLSGSGLGSFSSIGSAVSSAASNFASFFSGLGVGNIGGVVSSLTGTASQASTANTNASTGLASIGTLLTNIFKGITRSPATSATQDDTYVAVAGQADAVVGQASAIQQIAAALGQGTPDADDFERTSSSNLGGNWNIQQTGTGTLATPNGHDASFTGTGNVEFTARKTDKTAATLHQTSSLVLATAIPSYPFFTPLPYGGNIDLWVLMTNFTTFATRTGLRFRVNSAAPYAANWFIHWVSSGTETQLATGSLSIPAAGGSLDWEAGIGGNLKAYQARLNGSPVANFTDSVQRGTVGTHVYRGFGGKGTAGFGLPQGVPSVKVWTAQG